MVVCRLGQQYEKLIIMLPFSDFVHFQLTRLRFRRVEGNLKGLSSFGLPSTGGGLVSSHRQLNAEHGAAVGSRAYAHVAAVVSDDGFDDGQPKARTAFFA